MSQTNELMSEAEVLEIIRDEFGEVSPNCDTEGIVPHAMNGAGGC